MDSVVAMSKKCLLLAVVVLALSNCFEAQTLETRPSSTLLPAQVWSEIAVNLSADEVWEVYSSPHLPSLIVKLMPSFFQRIDVVSGAGNQGTVLNITLQPTIPGPQNWLEKFISINHRTRTKVVRQIWGGYLDIGFTLYDDIFKIIPTGRRSCVIRSTTSFIIRQGFESDGASFITASWSMPNAIIGFIRDNKAKNYLASKTSDS